MTGLPENEPRPAPAIMPEIARQENLTRRYVNQLLRLAFLDPDITRSILDGTQPVELTAKTLSNRPAIPDLWADQRQFLGFDPHR